MEMTGVMEDSFGGFQRAQPPQGDLQLYLDMDTYQPLKLISSSDG